MGENWRSRRKPTPTGDIEHAKHHNNPSTGSWALELWRRNVTLLAENGFHAKNLRGGGEKKKTLLKQRCLKPCWVLLQKNNEIRWQWLRQYIYQQEYKSSFREWWGKKQWKKYIQVCAGNLIHVKVLLTPRIWQPAHLSSILDNLLLIRGVHESWQCISAKCVQVYKVWLPVWQQQHSNPQIWCLLGGGSVITH